MAAVIAALFLTVAVFLAPAASAETFGQVSLWGGPGTGKAQFFNPAALGVDPSDGSVYAGDVTGDNANYRIQKLTAAGEFKGSVLIPRFEDEAKLIPIALHGVAVDHEKELIYVIRGCKVTTGSSVCQKNTKIGTTFNAGQVLIYKTAPESEKLVSAGSFKLPEGTEELYVPQTIAVDPSNHDIVIMAEDSAKHIVIQRFSSSGTPGARFVDSSNTLKPAAGREATSIAVGPSGITYTMTGAPGSAGAKFTRAWELPASLASLKEVAGFAAGAEAEGWTHGLQAVKMPVLYGGPQLAISPDGGTLYWKENLTGSGETTPGAVLVRGYSLSSKESTVLYGGGVSGTCQITTSAAGIGTTGNRLVVFDYGAGGLEPAYGDHVLTFGPGGSGCPIPTPKVKTNGSKVTELTVTKGDEVSFDAKESELFGKALIGLEWNFGDGTVKKVVSPPCEEEGCEPEPPAQTIGHRFLKAGKYVVKLKLTTTEYGQLPVPAEVVVNVVGGKPTASFTASTTTPEAGGTVEFNAGESVDPTGGACSQESGCASSHVLANYHWNFGDGTETDTASPTISHEFANEETTPVLRTVSLVVTSKDGVSSSPSEQGIEVQGAPPAAGLSCAGSGIQGWGSSLQAGAQLEIWKPTFEASICPAGPSIAYTPNNSIAGMRAWNYDGKRGSINSAAQFVGTDSAPTKAQIASITSVAGGASLLTVPVAQTAIDIVANPPAGCEIEAITNKQLEQVFRGSLKQWSDLATAEGACGSPIVRVVRKDESSVTAQLKNYLSRMFGGTLPCSSEGWSDLSSNWPESCEGTALSKVTKTETSSDGSMPAAVEATAGSIGYVPATSPGPATVVLSVQNNGQVGASEAEFAAPIVSGAANCSGASYNVPSGARRKSGEPATNVDWSRSFSAHPAVGGTSYPLCMLTYDLAFRGYKGTAIPFSKAVTVRDYLRWYVTAEGQEAINGSRYAPLPGAADSNHNVLGSAQYTAGKIKY